MKHHVVGWQRSLPKTPPKHSQNNQRHDKLRLPSETPQANKATLIAGSLKNWTPRR
jgi:hypothetical protein